VAYNHTGIDPSREEGLAKRRPQKRRTGQLLFIILSILVVVSMAIGYLLIALPQPGPSEPTPTPLVLLISALV
jgi:hypothetical protein